MKNLNLDIIRKEYIKNTLSKSDLNSSPIKQFQEWFMEYNNVNSEESNKMVLSTVSNIGTPSSRMVLLKGIDKGNFIFYTNYSSKKSQNILQNSKVAICIYFSELERQVNIQGVASKISEKKSIQYFNSRPLESKIAAIISNQSNIVPSRNYLEEKFNKLKVSKEDIFKPDNWGGYKVNPKSIEFWQGRPNRLHDRFLYKKVNSNWNLDRLAP